ncbi:MAG: helix-turn-helix domain-containing protein [Candidatus Kapabacteria bacterium]|nr:helix-turn-helix domain-containing protein [Candidatus Kapabacteria bacterium]MBX7153954.1 helix-turn-helix domain-containing protein [Bacteroidota bacterium]
MKHVCILIPETAVPAAILDPQYMFTAVNEFFQSSGHQPFFRVELVAATREVHLNNGMFIARADKLLTEVQQCDILFVPAISRDVQTALDKNREAVEWIHSMYKRGTEVASLCIGAFLVAESGILQGKTCSTHWLFANEFRTRYPDVELADGRIVTDMHGVYSSGGATSYWNLLLYLVEKFTSREMAIMASKFFLLDTAKNSQLPFSIFQGQKDHGDELVLVVQDFLESHYNERLSVDEIAEQFCVGRRTFERRFKKATNNTIVEYLQRVKIEAAKKQLEAGRKTVNEVMFEVGYTDTKAFRDVFKKITGLSPVEYRNKYYKELRMAQSV